MKIKSEPKPQQAGGQQVNINLDQTPILYTDNVMVTGNKDGIVLDFCQRLGSTPQVRIVSRIGMSREHAKKLLMVLAGQIEHDPEKAHVATKTVN